MRATTPADLATLETCAPSVEVVARKFSAIVRGAFGRRTLAEIRRRNTRYGEQGFCATQDFCDANMLMHEAFKEAYAEDALCDPELFEGIGACESEKLTDLWNSAWNMARRSGFRLGEVQP